MLSVLTLLATAALGSTGHVHNTQIEYQGSPVNVSYRTSTDVTTKQIGMSGGTRLGGQRCLWTARAGVVRELGRADNAVISQRLDADKLLSGSRPGSCALAKQQIARDVADWDDDLRAHLADVAAQDRSQLASDLEAMQRLTAK